jgi:predicted phage-related endonuclease
MDNITKELENLNKYLKKNNVGITYKNINQATEDEFRQIRMLGIGASDTSYLLEVNPFSPEPIKSLLNQKAFGEYDESISKKASVRMGKDLEALILEKVSTILKDEFKSIIKPVDMYGIPEIHLNTNFDGIGIKNLDQPKDNYIPIEAKVCTQFGRKYYDFKKSFVYEFEDQVLTREIPQFKITDIENIQNLCLKESSEYGIPPYYYTQLQQQILFLNSTYGYLTVLDVANWSINIFKIYSNLIVQNAIKNKASKLWKQVEFLKENPNQNDISYLL